MLCIRLVIEALATVVLAGCGGGSSDSTVNRPGLVEAPTLERMEP